MSTLVFTLFTFCPPAPPLRAKLVMTSSAHRNACIGWRNSQKPEGVPLCHRTTPLWRSNSSTTYLSCAETRLCTFAWRHTYRSRHVVAVEGWQEFKTLRVSSTSAYPLDEVLSGGARRLGAACHMARRPAAPPAAPPGPRHPDVCPVCEPSLLERRALRLQAEKPLPAPKSYSATFSCAPGLLAWQGRKL